MQALQTQALADGERALVVALEITMTLFCVLYAYPHIPSRLLDSKATTSWFSVASPRALRAAILHLLRQSPVVHACCLPLGSFDSVAFDDLGDPQRLDRVFGLRLQAHNVPTVCRQMFESLAAVLRGIGALTEVGTREDLQRLYRKYQLLPTNLSTAQQQQQKQAWLDRSNRAGLLRFCSEQAVQWLQPYFGAHPRFFQPRGLGVACA